MISTHGRMHLVENRELLDAYRRGETAAFERIFDLYAPTVSRWVTRGFTYASKDGRARFRGLASPVDVHDAIHEVFRAVFDAPARRSYSGMTPFEGYLFVITKNQVLKKVGAKAHLFERIADDIDESIASEAPSPEEIVAREEERRVVRDYLATLTEEERGFVDLRFSEELPQEAVGDRLGWTRKKVRLKEAAIRAGLTRFLKRRRGSAEVREVLRDGAR
jgi:RNA polymerase sigma factor (sigma-70 family)